MKLSLTEVWNKTQDNFNQLFRLQQLNPDSPDYGAIVDSGVAIPGHTGTALLIATSLAACHFDSVNACHLAERAQLALRWLISHGTNSNNRISSPDCNPDSGPDTAFVVQLFGGLLDVLKLMPDLDFPHYTDSVALLQQAQSRMIQGVSKAGFHTPNHRWVISSALAWGIRAHPEMLDDLELHTYLAEGHDADEEGFYPERSAAIYDAVSNRCFQLLSTWMEWNDGLQAVRSNLQLLTKLTNNSGTVETVLSTRQDRNLCMVPDTLLSCIYQSLVDYPEDRESLSALFLTTWKNCPTLSATAGFWLLREVVLHPEVTFSARATLQDGRWLLNKNSFLRERRGNWSLNAVTGSPHPFFLRTADNTKLSFSLAQAYMGTGLFRGNTLQQTDNGWSMVHLADSIPYRPGYELPLGRRVPVDAYEEMRARRSLRQTPSCASTLVWSWPSEKEALIHWSNRDQDVQAFAQICIDFPAGVYCQTDTCSFTATKGLTLFLSENSFIRLSGSGWSLNLGPGASAHTMNPMRDALPPVTDQCRVVIALKTPLDFSFSLQFD
jgi:hypothetical protein